VSEQTGALCSYQLNNLRGEVRYLSISVGGAVHRVRLWAAGSITILHAVQRTDPPTSAASRAAIDIGVCLGRESIHDRLLGWAIETGSAKVAAGGRASKTV